MSYFGNYLLEKGLVNEASLVEALSIQNSELTPLPVILREQDLLNTDELISILERQTLTGEPFVVSMKELGFWDDAIVESLKKAQLLGKRPIGHILSEVAPSCDHDLITKSLKEFSPKNQDSDSCDPLAQDEKFVFQAISGEALTRYAEIFTDMKKSQLEKVFNAFGSDFVSASFDQNRKDLQSIFDEVSVILECALYAKAMISEKLATQMMKSVEYLQGEIEKVSEDDFHLWLNGMLRGLDVLWEIRTFVDKSGNEKEFWQNPVSKSNFNNAYSGLRVS